VAILAGLLAMSLWLNVRQYGDRREAAAAARAATLEDTLEVAAGIARQAQSDTAGDVLPAMVVAVQPNGQVNAQVNAQVFLDGNDVLWVSAGRRTDVEAREIEQLATRILLLDHTLCQPARRSVDCDRL